MYVSRGEWVINNVTWRGRYECLGELWSVSNSGGTYGWKICGLWRILTIKASVSPPPHRRVITKDSTSSQACCGGYDQNKSGKFIVLLHDPLTAGAAYIRVFIFY